MPHNKSYTAPTEPALPALFTPSPVPAGQGPAGQAAARALVREGEAENTVRSYLSAMRYWDQWHRLRFGSPAPLPLSAEALVQFVVDHAQRSTSEGLRCEMPPEMDQALVQSGVKAKPGPLALATLEHRLSVLARAHRQAGLASPTRDPDVRELMTGVRRAYGRRGVAPAKKPALLREPLEALLATCDDSLRGVRDRALLLFAWGSGGRRRSEVSGAVLERLRKLGPGAYVYTLGASKTNQEGLDFASNEKPLMGRVAAALEQWLQRTGIEQGPLFRQVRRGGHLGEALSADAVRAIVIERSGLAGLSEPYSAHSLRSGFVSEASRQGMPLPEAMAMTGHQSVSSFNRYFRADARTLKPAFMLEDPVAGAAETGNTGLSDGNQGI